LRPPRRTAEFRKVRQRKLRARKAQIPVEIQIIELVAEGNCMATAKRASVGTGPRELIPARLGIF
jgi:hypothetical protein